MGRVVRVISIASVLCAFASSSSAFAIDRAECAEQYESAQRFKKAGRLLAARRALLTCVQDECPLFAKRDCDRWLVEVDASIPTVVITARDATGSDVSSVTVLVDGATVAPSLDGKAIALDPGAHVLRYTSHSGAVIAEEQITALEGEKNRKLMVLVGAPGEEERLETIIHPRPHPQPAPVGAEIYVLGAVGLVGLAGFGGFGAASLREESTDRHGCAPNCSSDQVHSIRWKEHAADLSLAVGIIALGAAAILFILRGDS